MKFSRAFSMPNSDTFSMPPVRAFIEQYRQEKKWFHSVDMFARNTNLATYRNDLSPASEAEYHMEAEAFIHKLADEGKTVGLAYFDPPYSPRQISECYKSVGLAVGMKETQNAALYNRVRTALEKILLPKAIVLSFGWNSNGMGKKRNATLLEILLCAHGGGHNDTICIAEQMP